MDKAPTEPTDGRPRSNGESDSSPRVRRAELFTHFGLDLTRADGLQAVGHLLREFCSKLFTWDALLFNLRRGRGSRHFRAVLLVDTIDGEKVVFADDELTPNDFSDIWTRLLNGEPVLINRTEPKLPEPEVAFGNCERASASLMYVPISCGDRISGVISLQSYTPNQFNESDLELLHSVADAVGPTLLRCRAEERMDDFLKLGERLNQVVDTTGVARVVANTAADLLGWDYISIHLLDPVTEKLHTVLGLRRSDDNCQIYPSAEYHMLPSDGLLIEVLNGRSIHLGVDSVPEEDVPKFYPFGDSLPLLASVMLSPIRSMNRVVGLLCLQSESTAAYGSDEADIARALADYCSGALERAWAQQNLQQSEEGYRLLVENVNDGIVISQNERFAFFNDRFATMLGYEPEELHEKTYKDVYTTTGLEILKQRGAFREAGVVVPDRYETMFKKKSGEILPVEANVRVIENYHGDRATFAVIRDISQRKASEQKLRRSEQELRALFNAMTDVIMVLDIEGRYLGAESGGQSFNSAGPAHRAGKTVYDLFSPEKADYLVRLIRRALSTRQTTNVEYDLEVDGEVLWYNSTVSPLTDDSVLVVARDVTERRKAEEELFRSNARYKALLDGSEDYIFVLDREMRFIHVNSVIEKRFGARVEDRIGKTVYEVYGDAAVPRFFKLIEEVFDNGNPITYDDDAVLNGHLICTETVISPVFSRLGEVEAVLGISRDVTSRRQSALALKRSEERYAGAVRGANDGIWDWNLETNGIYLSPRWWAIVGDDGRGEEGECDPAYWFDRVNPDDIDLLKKKIADHIAGETHYLEDEHRVLHATGEWRWVLCRGLCVRNDDGQTVRMAGSMSDITDRKNAEAKLQYGASHDALTNLPNRAHFLENLGKTMARARRSTGKATYAVLFLDLDRFKVVNDSLGHLAGDELIVTTARRLESCVRPGDTVARMGGDEFTVLLEQVAHQADVTHVAQRIIHELASPIEVKGFRVQTTVSMGIAFDKPEYKQPEDLLRDADTAMYRAKATGRNRYQIFDKHMHATVMDQLKWEAELRQAVARQEFAMTYQPIVAFADAKIIGFEALIRWNHPERGFTGPGEFIALAEETGLIIPIGWWVIDQALRAVSLWNQNRSEEEALTVSVNLSPRQFMQPNLVDHIVFLVDQSNARPQNLILEITENVLMDDSANVADDIQRLRDFGIRLDLDDFGTGYSSLSFLRRFPLDMIKIDQTFIRDLENGGPSREIVKAMLMLAKGLGLRVTAEGVETQQQFEALQKMDCDCGQGYFFEKPLPLAETLELIAREDSVSSDRKQ